MKRILMALLCVLFTLSALFLVACQNEQESSSTEGGKLQAPVVSIDEQNYVSWSAVEGAIAYEYKIDDGAVVRLEASILQIKLLPTEKITVRAIATSAENNSDWSAEVRAGSAPQLPRPALNTTIVSEMVFVTWEKDSRATGYEYRLNADAEKVLDSDSFGIQIGISDTLYVRAKGDGTNYTDSDWALVTPE